jgi:hypothetical protein
MGELLDRVVRLYRQNFLTFIGIVALVQVPLAIIQLLISLYEIQNEEQFSAFGSNFETLTPGSNITIPDILILVLTVILIRVIGTAALTRSIANNYLGQKTGILDAYRQSGRVWISLFGALILAGFFGLLLVVWSIIPCIGWFTGLGIVIYYIWVIVPLISPVIVLERQSPTGAIQRAWTLVRSRFWWVMGFSFLLIIFNLLLIIGPTAVVTFIFEFGIGNPFSPTRDQLVLQTVVGTITDLFFNILYLPLQLIGFALLYFDLRIRTEGFDLAVLASELAADGPVDVVSTIEEAPKGESGFVVSWTDLGYFAVITLTLGVLYLILVAIVAALISTAAGGPF